MIKGGDSEVEDEEETEDFVAYEPSVTPESYNPPGNSKVGPFETPEIDNPDRSVSPIDFVYEDVKDPYNKKLSASPSRGSMISNESGNSPTKLEISCIEGLDEKAFLIDVISYLSKKVKEKVTGDESEKKVKAGLKQMMQDQLNFYSEIIDVEDEEFGNFVISMMESSQLEQLLTGFLPVIKIDSTKYLIGTDVKTILIKSDQLLVRVGGGFITLS